MSISNRMIAVVVAGVILWLAAACSVAPQPGYATQVPDLPIPTAVPPLPFADNPDPALCGIPEPFDNARPGLIIEDVPGWQHPVIYLYDSHLRKTITGQVYPNTRVRILLSQSNPTLDFYFVETIDLEPVQRGWVPTPFVRLP